MRRVKQSIKVIFAATNQIGSLKWQWAGHVARHTENWMGYITRWRPRRERRSTGRPQQRWDDEIKKVSGFNWY